MVKQRSESAQIYTEQNRPDLAEPELAEAAVIETYLPKQMNEEELTEALKAIIAQVGATTPQEMGKVMGVATKQLAGACRWPRYFCESKRTVGLIQNKYLN